ncbi:MAG: c-type cytochrome [Rhodothermales bacterium]|nr:c-type cytochrome [Rhodothermales bacterium]MBO6778134.1 c-type cytochrome [Rhodothermales bacterium]
MKRALMIVAALGLAVPAQAQEPDLGTDAQREAGKVLYDAKCAHCHGLTGDGIGPATDYLRPAPRDFTSSTFKFRSSMSGELPSDEDIKRSIREGMPYTGMPPWPSLSESEITNLMYYIKTFADDFAGPFGIPELIEIPDAPRASEESIARGREVFLENQCVDCHGDLGRGDGPSAPTLTDQWGFHIRAADLTKRWTFRNGSSREDIYRTFNTGLDGSPMPAYEIEPIEDRWALVDYVLSLSNDEPNYATTLVADPVDAISEEAFEAARPALFPIVGQVVEPGRSFFPGVNAVEARALVTADQIAVRLRWHDLQADTRGSNGPDVAVEEVPGEPWIGAPDTSGTWSDAVALQFPTEAPDGVELPYFMFGDRKNSVDLWFADMAGPTATHYVGSGSNALTAEGPSLGVDAAFEDGAWTATFTRDRSVEGHIGFEAGTFIPVAFTVWDGFNAEAGNRRGISVWYNLYVDVADKPSPAGPMAGYGLFTLLLGVGITFYMRRKYASE